MMLKKIPIACLIFSFAAQFAFALYGTRPMGMGGAFTAVSDDANAPYWNPAGVALNPEVSLTSSTLFNNRNTFVGDNVANLKLCYETEMNPFEWMAGVGVASLLAYEGAKYLSDLGIVKMGWGREGEKTAREESLAAQVKGSEEVVSLRAETKAVLKSAANYLVPFGNPWYTPNYYRPRYWEPRLSETKTKAQFAAGLSWISDYNARPQIDQQLNLFTLSLASGFEQRVAIGGNVNLYNLEKISTGIRGLGADIDLGVIAKPVDYISVGVTTKGILTTDIKWQTDESTRNEMLVNAGLAIKPLYFLTLAADAHNLLAQNNKNPTLHFGAEAVLMPGLLARVGLFDGSKTAGLSLAIGNLILDYSILSGVFNRTQMVGGSWRF